MYRANDLKGVYYGPNVVKNCILSVLPTKTSKAFIVTGQSLATKTPLIKDLEAVLSPGGNHAGTFGNIRQHATVKELDEVTRLVQQNGAIDTIISVGGGSPIDSAKAIVFRVHEVSRKWLTHIVIPTTLSAAECTSLAGYTGSDGVKTSVSHAKLYPTFIFYDPKFGLYTPPWLFLSSGIRALDHAVELQYHPYATWIPTRLICLNAIAELFRLLQRYKAHPQDEDVITGLFLAAFASLGFLGQNTGASTLLLSHSLGYALGSPYGIPHGITSCMTLGPVVKFMARRSKHHANSIAAILPYLSGEKPSGDDLADAERVGDKILGLVDDLGLTTSLTEHGVGRDQIDIITARGLRLDPDKPIGAGGNELFQGVKELVMRLW
jgi:alcohol dehydrogenase class IV